MTTPMRIDEIIRQSEQPVFSFEFFPPRSEEGERNLREAIEKLAPLEPSFVSITYGAGGSTRERTVELTRWMKHELGLEAMSHLTGYGSTLDELRCVLDRIARGRDRERARAPRRSARATGPTGARRTSRSVSPAS